LLTLGGLGGGGEGGGGGGGGGGGDVVSSAVTVNARRPARCSLAQKRAHVASPSSLSGQSTVRWLDRNCAMNCARVYVHVRGLEWFELPKEKLSWR
jgi:hypothetical protein